MTMKRCIPVLLALAIAAPAALAIGFENVNLGLPPTPYASPGEWVLAQRIMSDGGGKVTKVHVFNAAVAARLLGGDVERIEIRRASDGAVMGYRNTAATLANLAAAGGVEIVTGQNSTFTAAFELQIWVKVKTSAQLSKLLELAGTLVFWETGPVAGTAVDYPAANGGPGAPATIFTVGPSPAIVFDGSVPDADIYRGQRFLAGRIKIDASGVPFALTITELLLTNIVGGTRLLGASIESIEVRRASDDALLRQETTAANLDKLATTGVVVATSSNNIVPAYSMVYIEIWVTLKANAPAAQLRLQGAVQAGAVNAFVAGNNDPVGDVAPVFDVILPDGFETMVNHDVVGGQVFSGQRFLAQRIECQDNDIDPFDVTVTSFVVQNVAAGGTRLADNQIASMEVVRASDGALMGSVAAATGFNVGGVRVVTAAANVAADDTAEIYEIWVTLTADVPHDRYIQLHTVIRHTEDGLDFGHPHDYDVLDPGAGVTDSAEFITGPAILKGFDEYAVDDALANRQVFQGVRFLAQRLKLKDNDADPYDILITSLMIRNVAPINDRLADQYVAKLEVRRKSDNALLGEVTDPVGLSLTGVRVTAAANNLVQDDGTIDVEIWVTLKTAAPAGRKLLLETIVWHTEGTAIFQTDTPALQGPATFTTKIGTPPRNVNFTTTPAAPKYKEETSFVPADNITDPEGDVTKATFHWNFGDGTTKRTTGSATVKHTYEAGGTYAVTLTVTGEQGLPSSKTRQITVEGRPNQPPSIDEMTATPSSPDVEAAVTFGATVTDPDHAQGPFTYAWDFGDAATSEAAAPTHAYDEAGVYTVTLTVTDPEGATDTETLDVSVGNEPPVVMGITHTPAAKSTGDEVTFTAQGVTDPDDDDITEYRWNFGDGTTGTTAEETATHVYRTPNTYTVTVTVVDERGGVSVPGATVSITVAGPTRVVMRAYPNPATTTATVTFFLPVGATGPELWIFDLNRNQLLREALPAGATQFEWDLRDAADRPVANGLYLCMITATSDAGRRITSEVFRLLVAR